MPALAADPVPFEPAPFTEPAPQRSVLLGIGAAVAPLYEGSDEYRVAPFPIIAPDFGGDGPRRFEFRALDDIRLHVLRLGGFSAGPLAGYRFGREESDAPSLAGLGDVDGGLVLGGFMAFDAEVSPGATVGVDLGISSQVTGDALVLDRDALVAAAPAGAVVPPLVDREFGFEVDLGASASIDLSPRANLALRAGAVYADDDYMDTHFSISPLQALGSATAGPALGAFDADAGVKNVYVNANLAFEVTERFEVRAGAGYSYLLGDASDSPISVTDHQFTGSLGVGYRIRF